MYTMATKEDEVNKELKQRLQATADEIVSILEKKDDEYGSSWKSRGGFSAFFQLDRKWSRIEKMAAEQNYDLFAAIDSHDDGPDALLDLIGYALLTLSETYDPPEPPKYKEAWKPEDGEPGREYVDQDRES